MAILISHANADKKLIDAFLDLLQTGAGCKDIPDRALRGHLLPCDGRGARRRFSSLHRQRNH